MMPLNTEFEGMAGSQTELVEVMASTPLQNPAQVPGLRVGEGDVLGEIRKQKLDKQADKKTPLDFQSNSFIFFPPTNGQYLKD